MRARRFPTICALSAVVFGSACSQDLDTTRSPPPRGTIGEELFGVMCDRVGAQALREDLTGASFSHVCHKDLAGAYADKTNEALLPPPDTHGVDVNGEPVPLQKQIDDRTYALSRIQALARRRADLIEALDATFPDVLIPVKDVKNADPTKSCNTPVDVAAAQKKLGNELADMLGRVTDLYKDGTIPRSTEAMGRLAAAFKASPEAQAAVARFSSRLGYRPLELALGGARPLMAYPRLRDFAAETLRVITSDNGPLICSSLPPADIATCVESKRLSSPGAAYQPFSKMLETAHEELRTATADPPAPPLVVTNDPVMGRDHLSRPRADLEFMSQIFYAEDPAFGGGVGGPAPSRYIVRRDQRGFAAVPFVNGNLPAPFVDKNGDGLPDVDDVGRFVTSNGMPPPNPFFSPLAVDAAPRDAFGRATATGSLLYGYIDTSHTFTAQLVGDLRPLVDPDVTHNHETMLGAVTGAYVLFGQHAGREASTRTYAPDPSRVDLWNLTHATSDPPPADLATRPVILQYNGYRTDTSGAIDLVHAVGQILGDKTSDDTLSYVRALMTDHPADVARMTGAMLAWQDVANKHPEGKLSAKSTFWDEMIDIGIEIAKEPGLLEDLLRALGADASIGMKDMYGAYMAYGDRITYDRQNLSGGPYNGTLKNTSEPHTPVDRSKPDTGFQRSLFQRFVQAIHDVNGVTACNKDQAVIHAKGVPIAGTLDMPIGFGNPTYKECEVFKIENLATFYLDSVVGKAVLYFRPSLLRNGVLGVGKATVDMIEQSSGIGGGAGDIDGFWDGPGSSTFRPKPQWLNRLVFFDQATDSPNVGDLNYPTNHFLSDLQGTKIGTIVCPERIIDDPAPGAADAAPDGKIRGLRTCQPGDTFFERDQDATMPWENLKFYETMTPTLNAFALPRPDPKNPAAPLRGREDLFIKAIEVVQYHWQDKRGTTGECDPSNPKSGRYCSQDGLVVYEPLLSEAFPGDLIPALHDLVKTLGAVQVPHCTAYDAKNMCVPASVVMQDGITVLAEATRALVDPERAKTAGVTDRFGKPTGLRNDGSSSGQITPIYLLTAALNNMDASFATYAATNPTDKERLPKWRSARSQLVDQFLRISGTGTTSVFANPSVPKITPTLVDVIRAQLFVHCPSAFTPPFTRCTWARDDMAKNVSAVISGPTFATMMDFMDALRQDDGARRELEQMMTYMFDAASQNDALAGVLASAADMIQVLHDDANLVPLYHVLAEAAASSVRDAHGNVVQTSIVDAQSALLARIADRAYDKNHLEICGREIDPNQVLNVAFQKVVTPMLTPDGKKRQTPLEVILDVIADVNRVAPDQTDKLGAQDYASIADNVGDFLVNKEHGLEQFYEIVRQGTQ